MSPFTVDEEMQIIAKAISFIRKAKISPELSGHLIYMDDGPIGLFC